MKYHNQEYVKKIADKIKSEPKDKIKDIMENLRKGQQEALYEFEAINSYTAPEEILRRTQAVYYYEDLFTLLEQE